MKTKIIIALIIVAIGGGYFLWTQYKKSLVKDAVEKAVADTVSILDAKHKKELSDCYEKILQNTPPIKVYVPAKTIPLSHQDSLAIAAIMSLIDRDGVDSLKEIIVHLATPKSGEREFGYEDDNITVTGIAYADYHPLNSDTINVQTYFTGLTIKDFPRDTIVSYMDRRPFIDYGVESGIKADMAKPLHPVWDGAGVFAEVNLNQALALVPKIKAITVDDKLRTYYFINLKYTF